MGLQKTFIFCIFLITFHTISATTIKMVNKCTHKVWPGIQPNRGLPLLERGGFELAPQSSRTIPLPPAWAGRFWGREGCKFDASGRGTCTTADCGGSLYCNGNGAVPPATLAEITLKADQDYYDVSLVDGYNLPLAITIQPSSGKGRCAYAGCVSDLNAKCPTALQVRSRDKRGVVACKSACLAFGSPMYCCTGSYNNPKTCKPTKYSRVFKAACPTAYSYAYDDRTSTVTCTGANYILTFCPHR